MSDRRHSVSVRIGQTVIERWQNYSIVQDMLQPAAEFHLELPNATAEVHGICAPDEEVEIRVDDTTIITGLIDDRSWKSGKGSGNRLSIGGRCRAGRLVDDAMPLGVLHGLNVKHFVEKCLGPWYPGGVTLTNADNRRNLLGARNLRGQGNKLAKVIREPGVESMSPADRARFRLQAQKKDPTVPAAQRDQVAVRAAALLAAFTPKSDFKVTPGMKRWQVIASFLQETGLLAWSTADGKQFFVGFPNYDQEPQFTFFKPKVNSERAAEASVLDTEIMDSMAERYSRVVAVGLGPADDVNHGPQVRYRAIEDNGPGEKGIGQDFKRPKTLIVGDDTLHSHADAVALARREMGLRDAHGHGITVTAQGHGQDGALFTFDTMADVEEEELGHKGRYLITRVEMTCDRENGERSTIHLAKKGAVIA